MCGIVGHVVDGGGQPDIDAVHRATEQLRHRGPDGKGVVKYERACLGHRRLSIIDIQHSLQPWRHPGGRYCLVFNGEIYNYLELRRDLEQQGCRFSSNGDTEVLMQLYVCYGANCLEMINGMFAFAVWDEQEQSLFMARDRVGKKPLYYSVYSGGLVFASEISALKTFSPVDTGLDPISVDAFFAYQFVPGERSIYKGVRKLPAGHCLAYSQGKLKQTRYWQPPFPDKSSYKEDELAEELTSLVDDAVRLRLRSDVPVGAFLSGGLDSAIVVSALVRLGADLDTFTVGFQEKTFDESVEAQQSADFFNTRHHAEILDLDLPETLVRVVKAFGEPFADPSALPTWHLCKSSSRGVKVALSGDGGDELFGGYRRYLAARWVGAYQNTPGFLRNGVFERLVRSLPEGTGYYADSLSKKAKLFVDLSRRMEETPGDLLPQTFMRKERERLFGSSIAVGSEDHVSRFRLAGHELPTQMMLSDIQTYLPDDILVKVDRMSMSHSLEVRAPLLDYRIVELAARLPLHLKISGARQKYLLQRTFADQLPKALHERKKHGFSVPVGAALRGGMISSFHDYVLDMKLPAFLERKEVLRLWGEHQKGGHDHGFKLWSILVFCIWYQQVMTA